jgi:hypothetical protein
LLEIVKDVGDIIKNDFCVKWLRMQGHRIPATRFKVRISAQAKLIYYSKIDKNGITNFFNKSTSLKKEIG